MKKRYGIASLTALSAIVILLNSCMSGSGFTTLDGMVWNTTYHIVYDGPENYNDSILSTLKEVENSVSVFREGSTVSKVNKSKEVEVDRYFKDVYEMSREINRKTGGMFDPTLAPLIEAWGFGRGHVATADTLRIDSLLQTVGIYKTHLKGNRIIKDNEKIAFNFSALAKGYGVDCVAEMFMRNGIRNFLIEIGGEIRCNGRNSRGEDWCISVDSPSQGDMNLEHVSLMQIYLSSGAVATSGNYRNFHTRGGEKYGHTISPVSGRPVKTDVLSATVTAPTTMLADALATSCMAMGSEEGLRLCDDMECGVMLVLTDLTIVSNEQFKGLQLPR